MPRREDAATAGVGYGLVATGGITRGKAIDQAHEALGLGEKRRRPASLAVLDVSRRKVPGAGRIVRRYARGSALATIGAPAAAVGTARLLRRRNVSKATSLVAQGVQGTGEAWKQKGKSLRSGAPLHVRLEAVGVGAAGAGAGSLAAHRALDVAGRLVKVHPNARNALTAAAAVPGALAALPAAKRVVRRSGYTVTPTGTRKMSKSLQTLPWDGPRYAIHRTRGRVRIHEYHGENRFTIEHRGNRVLAHRSDLTFLPNRRIAKASNDYLGRHVSPGQQRSRVIAAGATPGPGIGPLMAARQAGRYAPPGRERSAEVRQLAAPALGIAAGLAGGRRFGQLAERSPRVESGVRSALRGAHKAAERIPHAGLASVAMKSIPKESTLTPKRSGQLVGFLAAKTVVGQAAGQVATSRNLAAERRYNAHHPVSKILDATGMTDKQKGQLVRRKKAGAALSTVSAGTGLTALGMIRSRTPAMLERRNKLLAITAGIGGANALNSASVARREARATKATIAKDFRSRAQQRYMFAQHPEIAHRWADEMKHRKRKGAKKHPVLAANLPERVSKGTPPIRTTMDDKTANHLVHGKGGYGITGPLPSHLDRQTRMDAYQARYIASGGKKSRRWQRVANAGTGVANAGLAGATAAGLAVIGSRSPGAKRLAAPALHRLKHFEGLNSEKVKHKAESAALVAATAGGMGQLTAQGAKRRRAKYTSAPGGVAASNYRRMQAYTPGG